METGTKLLLGLGTLGALGGVSFLAYKMGQKHAAEAMADGFRKEGFGYLGTLLGAPTTPTPSSSVRPTWYAGDVKVIATGYQVTIYTKATDGSMVKAGTGVVVATAAGGAKIDIVDSTVAPWDPRVGEAIILQGLEKVSGGRVYPWGYPMPNQDMNQMVSFAAHGSSTGSAYGSWDPAGVDPIPMQGRAQWGGVRTIAVATHGVAGARGNNELHNFAGLGRLGTETSPSAQHRARLGTKTHEYRRVR